MRGARADRTYVFDVDAALRHLVSSGGSDLHLKVPNRPLIRVDGELEAVEHFPVMTPEDTEAAVLHMLTDDTKLAEWAADGEVDYSYAIEGVARFRVNSFRQRGWASLVIRAIPVSISTIDELNLPPVVRELAEEERGIVLLTGTTGSGKSTTLAAMVDHINTTMAKHVMTIEDPIEFLHQDKRSAINQREIGQDTQSFKKALRRVLRQDPDVILIGEMRDEETVHTALSAAETGHLVFSTVHTVDAVETVNRLIDFFPPHEQKQVRLALAGTLRGIICQRLVPRADGEGRCVVMEIAVNTGRIADAGVMVRDAARFALHGQIGRAPLRRRPCSGESGQRQKRQDQRDGEGDGCASGHGLAVATELRNRRQHVRLA